MRENAATSGRVALRCLKRWRAASWLYTHIMRVSRGGVGSNRPGLLFGTVRVPAEALARAGLV